MDLKDYGFCFSGVDPGASGALGFLYPLAGKLFIEDIPIYEITGSTRVRKEIDPVLLGDIVRKYDPVDVFIEDVHTTPQMGVTSAGTFMKNQGTIIGVMGALYVPRNYVSPSVWKSNLKVPANKKEAVSRAIQLFPACASLFSRPDRAEACMIGLYGCLLRGHQPQKRFVPG